MYVLDIKNIGIPAKNVFLRNSKLSNEPKFYKTETVSSFSSLYYPPYG